MNEAKHAEHGPWAVFLIFLRLGLTSFGGPVAHRPKVDERAVHAADVLAAL